MSNQPFAPESNKGEYKRNEVWVVDCRKWATTMDAMGHPHRRRFANKKEANKWCRQLIRDEATGRRPDAGPMPVPDLFAHYRHSIKASGRSEATCKSYKSLLGRFVKFLDEHGIEDVRDLSPVVVEQYRVYCSSTLSESGALSALVIPHTAFKWAVRVGYLDGNPFAGIELPKPTKRRRAFTDRELEKLLQDAEPARLRIWRFLLSTGLRRAEATGLSLEDAVLESPAPFLRVVGKGNKLRHVPLTTAAQELVRGFAADARKSGRERLLPVAYDTLGNLWVRERERLKLPRELKLHSFRHSFASTLVNRTNTPLTEASAVLGHSSVAQTEIYVHRDEARLRQGMAMLDAEFAAAGAPERQRATG